MSATGPALIAEWERQGYRFTKEKRGFDIIIVGDTIRNAEEYGNALLCFLNHGTGIKNILYRNLAQYPENRYHIFVEGQYRVDRLRESGSLHRARCTWSVCPSWMTFFRAAMTIRPAPAAMGAGSAEAHRPLRSDL